MRYHSQFSEVRMWIYFGKHFFQTIKESVSFLLFLLMYGSLSLSCSHSHSGSHCLLPSLCVCGCVCGCACVQINSFYFFIHIMEQNWIAAISFSNHVCIKTPIGTVSEFQMHGGSYSLNISQESTHGLINYYQVNVFKHDC